jgi:aminoglycoside/choline kinase family phosphotransferase
MKSREEMIRFCRESLGLPESVTMDFSPLEGRGSDRTFFRIQWNQKDTAILVRYDPKRVENTYYAAIAEFLRENDIPAPRLIRHAPSACLILMEDLGNTDLWSLRKTPWENRRPLYQKTLAIARRIHSLPEKGFPSGRVRLMESFGPDLYRWERDYFREHFVRNVCGIELEPSLERELESELSALGERLSGLMRCLVHRDLQSQNVMIRDGEPFLIDFQGMRFGSPFYDLGSLLCDPYVNLADSEREELLLFYYGMLKGGLDQASFRNYFWEASAQRLMQALGAYGFLGLRKGLKGFLDHIPVALRILHRAASQTASLPRLLDLSLACRQAVDQKR